MPDRWGNYKSQSCYNGLTNRHHCTYSSRLQSLLCYMKRQLRTSKSQGSVICQKCTWWKVLVSVQTRQLNRTRNLKKNKGLGLAWGACCPVPRRREQACSWNTAEEILQSGEWIVAGELCRFPALLATNSNMGKIGSRITAILLLLLCCPRQVPSLPLTRRLTRVPDILWLSTHP